MRPIEGPPPLRLIHVVAIGSLPRVRAERLTQQISRFVAIPCHLDASRLSGEVRRLHGREQADADYLLRQLEEHPAPAGAAVVGIAETDLGLPILTYVFGVARAGGHTAVVSLARLKQEFYGLPADEKLTGRRVVAEVLHEVGHLLGLRHCAAYDCVMHFCADVGKVDLRGTSFCPSCAADLPPGFLRIRHAPSGR